MILRVSRSQKTAEERGQPKKVLHFLTHNQKMKSSVCTFWVHHFKELFDGHKAIERHRAWHTLNLVELP